MSVSQPPLCVDLDGTLVMTDTLWESAVRLIKRNPLHAFRLLIWLIGGKANLKHEIARRTELDPRTLPYHKEFLDFLKAQRGSGRTLVLCTASNEGIAGSIASHLNLFDEVIASDRTNNVRGKEKAERLVARFGAGKFDYAGNGIEDRTVFDVSRKCILVRPSATLTRAMRDSKRVERIFPRRDRILSLLIEAARPVQWSKNVLLFVPIVTSHNLSQLSLLGTVVAGFIAFCLCASGAYMINDVLDLEADRAHEQKRRRPFASGRLDIAYGVAFAPALIALSFVIGNWLLGCGFFMILMAYFASTLVYSVWIKSLVVVDVLLLSGLYTIRIIAGAIAINVDPSFWLLAFSMFVFLSLANVKRYVELHGLSPDRRPNVIGRGYDARDLQLVAMLGTSSGYLSVLVLALYVNSTDVASMYSNPRAIWLLCPILLYWIGRIWMKAFRDNMHSDPVVFAAKDPVSYFLAAIAGAVLYAAML